MIRDTNMWFESIAVIVVGSAIGLSLVFVLRRRFPPRRPPPGSPFAPHETPLEILQRRYASGEITAEEFVKGRELLGGGDKS